MKYINFYIILLIVLVLTYPTPVFAKEFLQNLGFDVDLSHWNTNGSSISFERTTNEHHNGEASVKITNTKTETYGIEQTVTGISDNENYQIQTWVKIGNDKVNKAFLRVAWYKSEDGSGSQESNTSDTNEINVQSDWQHLSKTVDPPDGVKSAKLRLVLSSKSENESAIVYFDDVSFATVESSPTPTPTTVFTPTPTQAVSPTRIPAKTSTASPKPKPTSTSSTSDSGDKDDSSEINKLRNQISGQAGSTDLESTKKTEQLNKQENSKKPDIIAIGLIGGGTLLLLAAAFPLIKKIIHRKKEEPFIPQYKRHQ